MAGTLSAGKLRFVSDRAERRAGKRPRDIPRPAPAAPPDGAEGPDGAPDHGPIPLRVAVLALWIEAALMALLTGAALARLVVGDADRMDVGIWLVAGLALVTAALWIAARLIVHRRQPGQGLAVSLQLTALPVAFFMASGDSGAWIAVGGVAIGVAALAVIALLLAPPSRAAFPRR